MSWQDERLNKISTLLEMVMANGTVGDVAEFGVFAGVSLNRIAKTLGGAKDEQVRMGLGPRSLHAFDSFQGLPKPVERQDAESPLVKSGTWAEGKMVAMTPAQCRMVGERYLSPDRVHVYAGYFCDTLSTVPRETNFAFAHIDCDLYSSTMDVLGFIIPRLSDGAVILLDDFFENCGSPKHGQRAAWEVFAPKLKTTPIGHYGRSSYAFLFHKDHA